MHGRWHLRSWDEEKNPALHAAEYRGLCRPRYRENELRSAGCRGGGLISAVVGYRGDTRLLGGTEEAPDVELHANQEDRTGNFDDQYNTKILQVTGRAAKPSKRDKKLG